MDQKLIQVVGKALSCSVCLDLLKDPTTLPCGHSYCRNCIQNYWREGTQRRTHSCPQCRRTFNQRPVLEKNIMLAELVEELKKTSDCKEHLHEDICPCQNKEMKNFCRADQQCICYICLLNEKWRHEKAQKAKNTRHEPQELHLDERAKISLKESFICVCLTISLIFNAHLIVKVTQLPEPEPTSREEFLKYSGELTLDPNTANPRLFLSEANRKATFSLNTWSYPYHLDRFSFQTQVLSREKLWGRRYWEVEWTRSVYVAVAYKDSKTSRSVTPFGNDDKSWALYCKKNGYVFYHKEVQTPLLGPVSSRVGVYLDHAAGVLSFYSVSENMTLIYRVHTTFTQPLHAGLGFYNYFEYRGGDSAEFIQLK